MVYDLAQPHFNGGPQFPGQPPNTIVYQQVAAVKAATVEECRFMSHSASHIDAPFHYLPQLKCIHELPLGHFYGPCVALDLRPLQPSHAIVSGDLRKHEELITPGTFVLLKTGWGDKRENSKEFLTAWPYVSGDAAKYLLDRGVKGLGIDVLSTGGYGDYHVEADAHMVLLGAEKLLLEDIRIPDELLDGKRRHFAAFPILIANAGGSWVRPVVWDTGDLDGNAPAPEMAAKVPEEIAYPVRLQRERR